MWQQEKFQKWKVKNYIYIHTQKIGILWQKKFHFLNFYYLYIGEISLHKKNANGWQCESCSYN
jgi:hypothetical protein